MHPVISIALIIILLVLIVILGSQLRESFLLQKKGLPPYISTYLRQRDLFRQQLVIPKGASIVDLGCGDGTMLRLFVKKFSCKKAVGYDINKFAIRRGKTLNRLHKTKQITLINDDLFNADLRWFDYIYLYLLPDFMEQLEDRLFDNISDGTTIISNSFSFVKHKPLQVIRNNQGEKRLFLYRK